MKQTHDVRRAHIDLLEPRRLFSALTPGLTVQSTIASPAEADSGRRRAAGLEPGDLDVWTINTTKGQYISAVATENNPGSALNIGMLMIAPNGTIVGEKTSPTGLTIQTTHDQTVTGKYYV